MDMGFFHLMFGHYDFSGMGIMLIVSLVFIMSLMLFFLRLCLVMRVFVRCACRKNQQGKRRNNK